MNNYIEQSKAVILDYLAKAKRTESKIAEGRNIYLPESMEQEEKRLRGELAKARKDAENKLNDIYSKASESARSWATLDGSKLTADAELLKGDGVTPEQFDQLVERYQDNYTMLDALRKYGERKNNDANKAARDAGEKFVFNENYNVRAIPAADTKMQEWDNMRRRADYFLDVADGRGMDKFEWTMAKAAGDKEFEAWGNSPEIPTKQNGEEISKAFNDAWGFIKE